MGVAWWVVSDGSEGLRGALTTAHAPDKLFLFSYTHRGDVTVFLVSLDPPQLHPQL